MEVVEVTCCEESFQEVTHDGITVIIDTDRRINVSRLIDDPKPINDWLNNHFNACREMKTTVTNHHMSRAFLRCGLNAWTMVITWASISPPCLVITLIDIIDIELSVRLMFIVYYMDQYYDQGSHENEIKLKNEVIELRKQVKQLRQAEVNN